MIKCGIASTPEQATISTARTPEALLAHGIACAGKGRLPEAEQAARALLTAAPTHIPGHYFLADVLAMAGRETEGLAQFGRAIANEFNPGGDDDPWSAALTLVRVAARAHPSRWQLRLAVMKRFGTLLSRVAPEAPEAIWAALVATPLVDAPAEELPLRLQSVCDALGFGAPAPEWNAALFERLLLPWMLRALATGHDDAALCLENETYRGYVKPSENEAHFGASFARWKGAMTDAGRRVARERPAPSRRAGGTLPRVGFFVHNTTGLAHVQMLLEVLEGHAELPRQIVEPYLFTMGGDPAVLERFRRAGVRLEALTSTDPREGAFLPALLRVRERVAQEGIECIVWVSLAVLMPFAFALRLAPRQVWWAMKYHALELDDIDGHVTGGSQTGGTKPIHGRTWRVGPVASASWMEPALTGEAARTRAALGAPGTIFGSFGREEKLDSPAFIDAVCAILAAEPGAIFLWTGRVQLASIQQRFEAAGVASRCRFIGWVNTRLYAQVIDVFLDSFPFPCGFTLYEAMAAGKPVVLFASAESENNGIHALVGPLLANSGDFDEARLAREIFRTGGEDLYFRPADPGAYIEVALRLARDAGLRGRAGHAAQAFVERLMADRRNAARIYLDHILGREPAQA